MDMEFENSRTMERFQAAMARHKTLHGENYRNVRPPPELLALIVVLFQVMLSRAISDITAPRYSNMRQLFDIFLVFATPELFIKSGNSELDILDQTMAAMEADIKDIIRKHGRG